MSSVIWFTINTLIYIERFQRLISAELYVDESDIDKNVSGDEVKSLTEVKGLHVLNVGIVCLRCCYDA